VIAFSHIKVFELPVLQLPIVDPCPALHFCHFKPLDKSATVPSPLSEKLLAVLLPEIHRA
jgi:hypothetical protein